MCIRDSHWGGVRFTRFPTDMGNHDGWACTMQNLNEDEEMQI